MANDATSSSTGREGPPTAPPTVVVILRCTLPPPLLDHLFAIGAAGYLPAAAAAEPPAGQWIAAAADATANAPDADPSPLGARLSPRELEVVRLIGLGHATRAIAAMLHRSVKTIESYKSRIKAKLGLNNPTELAQWAWRFAHAAGTRPA
jgi:DNA-binding NarL/FixJ family response regulator